MTELRAGFRVRCTDNRERVGTIETMHKVTADVLFDGDDAPTRMKLEDIESKVGRTAGTVREPHKPVADVDFENVTSEVVNTQMKKLKRSWGQLQERSGLSKATIARIVRGEDERLPATTLEALAKALGISPSSFWRKAA